MDPDMSKDALWNKMKQEKPEARRRNEISMNTEVK